MKYTEKVKTMKAEELLDDLIRTVILADIQYRAGNVGGAEKSDERANIIKAEIISRRTPKAEEPKTEKITTKCYGKIDEWESRESAINYFTHGYAWSDGSEQERYASILAQLHSGCTYATDEI